MGGDSGEGESGDALMSTCANIEAEPRDALVSAGLSKINMPKDALMCDGKLSIHGDGLSHILSETVKMDETVAE